jgi:carbonic anhydrase
MSKEARPLPATVIGEPFHHPAVRRLLLPLANTLLAVSCADPRCDPSYLFALKPGEAIVFRNMGGRVRSLLGDIVAMDALVGLKHLLVIHHTDCGATFEPAEAVRQGLNKLPGADSDAIQALSLPNYSE